MSMSLQSFFWYISITSKILNKMYSEGLEPLGLNSNQGRILLVLSEFEEANVEPVQNDLVKRLGLNKVSIHQLLLKLQSLEYVFMQKRSHDMRCNVVKLTIKGRYLVPRIKKVELYISSFIERRFTAQNREELITVLKHFIAEEFLLE